MAISEVLACVTVFELFVAIRVVFIGIQGCRTHHARHGLVVVYISNSLLVKVIILGLILYPLAIEVGTQTGHAGTRKDAEYISLMFGKF